MFKNAIIIVLVIALGIMFAAVIQSRRGDDANSELISEDEELGDEKVEIEDTEDEPDTVEEGADVEEMLVGSWASADIAGYMTTFRANGTLTDSYEAGAVVEEGTYTVFRDADDLPDKIRDNFESEESDIFIRETFRGENYFYLVESITDGSLELVELASEDELSFERVDR